MILAVKYGDHYHTTDELFMQEEFIGLSYADAWEKPLTLAGVGIFNKDIGTVSKDTNCYVINSGFRIEKEKSMRIIGFFLF